VDYRVMIELSDTSTEMSLHIESDGALMESTMAPRNAASRLNAAAGDTSLYTSARKPASSRRVVNRGRSTTNAESTRSYRSGSTATARQSLLGRPVNARPSRRDARYRRCQVAVFNFLERPKNWRSILYHLLVWVLHSSCCCSGYTVYSVSHVSRITHQLCSRIVCKTGCKTKLKPWS